MIKKSGFTLAELLVALTIVGIISAITIPSIHKILPDKDKGAVLRTYKALNEINNDIFGNPSLYMFGRPSTCTRFILQCTDGPVDGAHNNNFNGPQKYPRLLTEHLTLADNATIRSDGSASFNTSDGITWNIEKPLMENGNLLKAYIIEIRLNNSDRLACAYSSTCRNPGYFRFAVDKYGTIRPWDALTEAYINNPSDLSDRHADLGRAAASTTSFVETALD